MKRWCVFGAHAACVTSFLSFSFSSLGCTRATHGRDARRAPTKRTMNDSLPFDISGGNLGAAAAKEDGGANAMARDLEAFCRAPENAETLAKHQREELRKLDRVQHRCDAMDFRDAVLRADEEAQRCVAPFLRTRVLRNMVSTFRRDERGDFGKWATNPLVLEMLGKMQKDIDEGRRSEEEVEELIVRYLQDPKNPGHEEFTRATTRQAVLETKDLVGALNEQVELRCRGNTHYANKEFEQAYNCYERALSIMNLVKAVHASDAEEIKKNKLACLMNLGSVCMAMKHFGEAVEHLDDAEKLLPNDPRLLCRRGRAHVGRGHYKLAKADFTRVLQIDPVDAEAHTEMSRLRVEVLRDRARVKKLSKTIFAA